MGHATIVKELLEAGAEVDSPREVGDGFVYFKKDIIVKAP